MKPAKLSTCPCKLRKSNSKQFGRSEAWEPYPETTIWKVRQSTHKTQNNTSLNPLREINLKNHTRPKIWDDTKMQNHPKPTTSPPKNIQRQEKHLKKNDFTPHPTFTSPIFSSQSLNRCFSTLPTRSTPAGVLGAVLGRKAKSMLSGRDLRDNATRSVCLSILWPNLARKGGFSIFFSRPFWIPRIGNVPFSSTRGERPSDWQCVLFLQPLKTLQQVGGYF